MEDVDGIEETRTSLQTMTRSISSVRQTIRQLRDDPQTLNTKDGISLLSIKHHVMLSYLRSLVLLSVRRILGHNMAERENPKLPFSSVDRDSRGSGAGDLVDIMIEGRCILEKTRVLEGKLNYQIDKLVRLAREPEKNQVAVNDPLAFRPNPQNLEVNQDESDSEVSYDRTDTKRQSGNGIYHPPRLAPVPYTEDPKSKARKERVPVPTALTHITADPSRPYVETTSGLGGIPQLGSKRAAYLKKLQDFEEENFTRVIMKKSEAKRRYRDEAALALGSDLAGSYNPRARRRAGGLEDEFGDVLQSVGRDHSGNDGYEDLRRQGKKADVLSRSRDTASKKRTEPSEDNVEESRRMGKRSRFELEAKLAKRKMNRKR